MYGVFPGTSSSSAKAEFWNSSIVIFVSLISYLLSFFLDIQHTSCVSFLLLCIDNKCVSQLKRACHFETEREWPQECLLRLIIYRQKIISWKFNLNTRAKWSRKKYGMYPVLREKDWEYKDQQRRPCVLLVSTFWGKTGRFAFLIAFCRSERQEVDPSLYSVEDVMDDIAVRLPGSIDGHPFTISNCLNANIFLFDHMNCVTINDCKDCTLFLGPTKGR